MTSTDTASRRHLIILGIRGIPAAHGGFETFVERLAPHLRDRNWTVTVYCQGSETRRRHEDDWHGIRRVHIPVSTTGALGTIEFDMKAAIDAARRPGLILTLGYNTAFLSSWLAARGRTNVINMDGLEWKRAKYGRCSRAFLWINERLATWSGSKLIADHPVIADHLATRAPRSRIVTIPYGADEVTDADPAALAPFGIEPDRFMTVIARPEPENSVLEIVQAFSRRPSGMKLVVLGNYLRDVSYHAAVLEAAGEDVIFPGAIYEKSVLRALRRHSRAYLHGHQVGGTNPSLVEALGAGNAVIAHDNAFNRWVVGETGLFFRTADECARHIALACSDDAIVERMRMAARARWREAFRWEMILADYERMLGAQLNQPRGRPAAAPTGTARHGLAFHAREFEGVKGISGHNPPLFPHGGPTQNQPGCAQNEGTRAISCK